MILCNIVAVICVAYFVFLEIYCSFSSKFFFIWLFLGGMFFLLGQGIKREWFTNNLTIGMQRMLLLLCVICICLFLIVEGLIFSGYRQSMRQVPEYLIVLGATVREDGPSKVLR